MKERMFSTGLPLKTSLLLLGIFLVLAVAIHPTMVAAQTVSCQKLDSECANRCNSNFGSKDYYEKRIGCLLGCGWYEELCFKHLGEAITR